MTATTVSSASTDLQWLEPLATLARYCYQRLLVELPAWTLDGGNRFYWVYLLSFVMCGAWALHRYYPRESRPVGGLWRFLFPGEVYRHPSAVLDYQLLLANRLLGPSGILFRALLGSASVAAVGAMTQQWLTSTLGDGHQAAAWTPVSLVAFTVCIALVSDFSTYVVHGLHHRFPLLWEFHKVHHSAEVLTPFTVYRKHPVYNVLSRMTDLALLGPFQGLVAFLFAGPPALVTLFGANFAFSLFHIFGANLRHSHIWWSFGPMLSRLLISPAQHQIHHSKDPRHYNKNYGEMFALWDWLFGTLYVPGRTPEALSFGLMGEEAQTHPTLLAAYLVPFRNCARILRGHCNRLLPGFRSRPI